MKHRSKDLGLLRTLPQEHGHAPLHLVQSLPRIPSQLGRCRITCRPSFFKKICLFLVKVQHSKGNISVFQSCLEVLKPHQFIPVHSQLCFQVTVAKSRQVLLQPLHQSEKMRPTHAAHHVNAHSKNPFRSWKQRHTKLEVTQCNMKVNVEVLLAFCTNRGLPILGKELPSHKNAVNQGSHLHDSHVAVRGRPQLTYQSIQIPVFNARNRTAEIPSPLSWPPGRCASRSKRLQKAKSLAD